MNALELVISLFGFILTSMFALLIYAMKKFIEATKKDIDSLTKSVFNISTKIDVLTANFKNAFYSLTEVEKRLETQEKETKKLTEKVLKLELEKKI